MTPFLVAPAASLLLFGPSGGAAHSLRASSRASSKCSESREGVCNVGFSACDGKDEADVIVLGHMSPDTDAVGGALIRAWELGAKDGTCARPAINRDELNRETAFVLAHFCIDAPATLVVEAGKHYAIVDTNNIEEITEDFDTEQFTEQLTSIVDHHRIAGNLRSNGPLEWDNRAIASTGSVLYQRAKAAGLAVPGEGCDVNVAGLMLSTILSDTLNLISPTTTDLDVQAVGELGVLSGIGTMEECLAYGEQMLDAKSNIDGISAAELVVIDSKKTELVDAQEAKFQARVSVFETVRPENVLAIQDEISAACDDQLVVDQEETVNERVVLFFAIDIAGERAIFIPSGEPYGTDLVLNSFADAVERDDGTIELPGVVSRKKSIIPGLLDGALITPYDGEVPVEVDCLEFRGQIICPDGTRMERAQNRTRPEREGTDDQPRRSPPPRAPKRQ